MPKEELLKGLPSDVDGQKRVKNNVQELVDQMLIIQAAKEQMKDIQEVAKEKGVCPTWLKLQADIKYDRIHNFNKNNEKVLDKAQEVEMNQEIFS